VGCDDYSGRVRDWAGCVSGFCGGNEYMYTYGGTYVHIYPISFLN